jgi:phytoene dehydrogenase-like protein
MLQSKGLKVLVVEEQSIIGGATRTEKPFKKAPNLGCSTASYLLGLMPPGVCPFMYTYVAVDEIFT